MYYLLCVLTVALWASNVVIARGLYEQTPPFALSFLRWSCASIFLALIYGKSVYKNKELIKASLLKLSILALTGVSVFNTCIYIASRTTTAINMSLIAITAPVFMLIFSRIALKERINGRQFMGILCTLGGVLLLISDGSLSTLLHIRFVSGDLWMLVAASSFATYSLLIKVWKLSLPLPAILLSTFSLGSLFLLPFYIYEHFHMQKMIWTPYTITTVLYLGIITSVLCFFLWNRSVARLGLFRSAVIYNLVPVFATLYAGIFLNESITMVNLFSMILIIGGILTANSRITEKSATQ
jgi:drug/metabolite transporter (DMT)-like permease